MTILGRLKNSYVGNYKEKVTTTSNELLGFDPKATQSRVFSLVTDNENSQMQEYIENRSSSLVDPI